MWLLKNRRFATETLMLQRASTSYPGDNGRKKNLSKIETYRKHKGKSVISKSHEVPCYCANRALDIDTVKDRHKEANIH